MDTFVEQIVRKKKTAVDWLIIFGISVAALIVSFLIWRFVYFLLPTVVLIVWGAWWVATGRNIEFEYCITNGEMDIDTIIAQRRRKRLCGITCSKVEAYGELSKGNFEGKKFDRTIMAAPELNMDDNYYFIYRSKKYGRTLVIFHPDERVRQAFFSALPRLMQIQLEKESKNG